MGVSTHWGMVLFLLQALGTTTFCFLAVVASRLWHMDCGAAFALLHPVLVMQQLQLMSMCSFLQLKPSHMVPPPSMYMLFSLLGVLCIEQARPYSEVCKPLSVSLRSTSQLVLKL